METVNTCRDGEGSSREDSVPLSGNVESGLEDVLVFFGARERLHCTSQLLVDHERCLVVSQRRLPLFKLQRRGARAHRRLCRKTLGEQQQMHISVELRTFFRQLHFRLHS